MVTVCRTLERLTLRVVAQEKRNGIWDLLCLSGIKSTSAWTQDILEKTVLILKQLHKNCRDWNLVGVLAIYITWFHVRRRCIVFHAFAEYDVILQSFALKNTRLTRKYLYQKKRGHVHFLVVANIVFDITIRTPWHCQPSAEHWRNWYQF